MRLRDVDEVLRWQDRLKLRAIHALTGFEPGPVVAANYRREAFGKPFFACVNECLLEARHWTRGETELFAAFVSARAGCQFCFHSHTAVAVRHLAPEVVEAAIEDPETAPLDPRVRATLVFLEKLTLEPVEVVEEDVERALAAGVSHEALAEAAYVLSVFSIINRIADAFDFTRPTDRSSPRVAWLLDRLGYPV